MTWFQWVFACCPRSRRHTRNPSLTSVFLLMAFLFLGVASLLAYPLDGYTYTQIRRLLAYQGIQEGRIAGSFRLQPGALLSMKDILLRLADGNPDYDITNDTVQDAALQKGLERILAGLDPSYKIALLDITDPQAPRYAAINPKQGYIPGSVGKLLVMTAVFEQLRRRFPHSTEARAEFLRNTMVTADRFVQPNHHSVPVVNSDMTAVSHRSVRIGDTFSLWEWIDHMASPSSNAAASVVWKHALLMSQFGNAYPVTQEQQDEFFNKTPKANLTDNAIAVIEQPLIARGLDPELLRIRTFFTRTASRIVPGRSSYSTPRELLRWLVRLEQGKLVDRWSSLEMKKMLYFTRRRYRYAAAAALNKSAVYFKSGSLYRCKPEPGYKCGQYKGNAQNLMHSVAIVESPAATQGEPMRVYLLSMMSNVLKINSAAEHMQIGTEIERLVQRR